MKLKTSKRIKAIVNMAEGSYDHVWDICCDHGKIGILFAQQHQIHSIHFVDQVPSITEELKAKLNSYIPKHIYFDVITGPGEKLQIENKQKNLFILAGIGSETIIDILNNFKNQKLLNNDFLISSHKHPHKIRQYLIENNLKLFKEILIYDGNQYYEMMLVSMKAPHSITLVGDLMWDFQNTKHIDYFNRLVHYNKLKAKNGDLSASSQLKELLKLKDQFKL